MGGFEEVAGHLLESGADVNLPSKGKHSAIHCAVSTGHADMIEMLLDFGADVNSCDEVSSCC